MEGFRIRSEGGAFLLLRQRIFRLRPVFLAILASILGLSPRRHGTRRRSSPNQSARVFGASRTVAVTVQPICSRVEKPSRLD